MVNTIKINTEGIKSVLGKLKFSKKQFFRSVSEYIWNGFDAEAKKVELIYELNWKGSIDRTPFHLPNKGSIHRTLF